MSITKPSLISRRNFTLTGAHDSALIITLTLGTSLFMYNKNNSSVVRLARVQRNFREPLPLRAHFLDPVSGFRLGGLGGVT